jgi:hypothetical protein
VEKAVFSPHIEDDSKVKMFLAKNKVNDSFSRQLEATKPPSTAFSNNKPLPTTVNPITQVLYNPMLKQPKTATTKSSQSSIP